jgi:hypothetical protein
MNEGAKQMTGIPVTLEALEAAARYAGYRDPSNSSVVAFHTPKSRPTLFALARMIMEHEPDLIAESFDARTEREYYHAFQQPFSNGLLDYRDFIQQHIKDAKP